MEEEELSKFSKGLSNIWKPKTINSKISVIIWDFKIKQHVIKSSKMNNLLYIKRNRKYN